MGTVVTSPQSSSRLNGKATNSAPPMPDIAAARVPVRQNAAADNQFHTMRIPAVSLSGTGSCIGRASTTLALIAACLSQAS